jgi:hypothetical protein
MVFGLNGLDEATCDYSLPSLLLALAGCAGQRSQEPAPRAPAEVKAEIVRLMPAKVPDREGWATDIYAAFAAQHISPTTQNLCSVLAVAEQESTYQVDPTVPGWARSLATKSTVVPPKCISPACWSAARCKCAPPTARPTANA